MQYERASIGKTKFGPSQLDVSKKTLGIIGTGTIGRRVFKLLLGFNMNVIAYDPYPTGEWAKANCVSYVGLVNYAPRPTSSLYMHPVNP
jgi:phosphoglycerate dehydrogenase-like enzyme